MTREECEAIGERFDNVMPSQVIRERAPWMHRALAGERVSFEISQDDGDGGVRYMLVTYTPHFGEGDGVRSPRHLQVPIFHRPSQWWRDGGQ